MFSYDFTLEFSEAIFGVEKEFELSHLETCEVCAGTGGKVGSKMRVCSTCGGRGQVMRTEQTPFGLFSQVRASGFYSIDFFLHFSDILCMFVSNQNQKHSFSVISQGLSPSVLTA